MWSLRLPLDVRAPSPIANANWIPRSLFILGRHRTYISLVPWCKSKHSGASYSFSRIYICVISSTWHVTMDARSIGGWLQRRRLSFLETKDGIGKSPFRIGKFWQVRRSRQSLASVVVTELLYQRCNSVYGQISSNSSQVVTEKTSAFIVEMRLSIYSPKCILYKRLMLLFT